MGRIFPHVLAYPDQNAEKSCKEEEEEGGEFARIEHAAKQQLKTPSATSLSLTMLYYDTVPRVPQVDPRLGHNSARPSCGQDEPRLWLGGQSRRHRFEMALLWLKSERNL